MSRATDQIRSRRTFLRMLSASPLLVTPGILAGSLANLLAADEVTENKFLGWLDSFQQSNEVISSPDKCFDVMDFEPAARKAAMPGESPERAPEASHNSQPGNPCSTASTFRKSRRAARR